MYSGVSQKSVWWEGFPLACQTSEGQVRRYGRFEGMLLGINLLTFDIGEIEEGEFFVKFKIRNKDDGFQWLLVSVYGAAQPSLKESFLTELAHLCAKELLPMILGGDFNIIRGPREKSNSNYNDRWPFPFNAI